MKQYGQASVFGLPITGSNNVGGPWAVYGPFGVDAANSTAGQKLETLEDTEEADIEELRDENGELIGAAARNRRNTITIDFVPIGVRDETTGKPDGTKNTIDNAVAALELPGIWTKVTLKNLPDTSGTDIAWNKDYIYRGGGVRTINADGTARVRMTLEDPTAVGDIGSPLTVDELILPVA